MKDKIILLGKNEIVSIAGNNSRDVVVVNIINDELNFAVYQNSSAQRVATTRSFVTGNNKPLRMVDFDDEIYLRAKSDTEAIAPICIEENGNRLDIIDLLATDCTSTVEDMKGDIKRVAENFDIVTGEYFLKEDSFSL